MVQSLNTKAEYVDPATWFRGGPSYGKLMIGDKGFEFYRDNNVNDYVQIPWEEITYVIADVYFGGKYIPRFKICTRLNGDFIFAARHARQTLKAINQHIPAEHMRRALSAWQKVKRNIFRKK